MKISVLLIFILFFSIYLPAQNKVIDSLSAVLKNEKTDTDKIILLYKLSEAYQVSKPDSALLLAQQAYFMARNKKFIKGESWSLNEMAFAFNNLGNFPKALEYYLEQLKIEETRGYPDNIAGIYLNIALLYNSAKDYDKAIFYAKKADSIINTNKFETLSIYSSLDIGDIYEKSNMLDSALAYTKKCYAKSVAANNNLITGTALNNLGNIYAKSGNFSEAYKNYKAALPLLDSANDYNTYAESMLGLARIFDHKKEIDSAIVFGIKSFDISYSNQFLLKALDASIFLSHLYKEKNNSDSAFAYQETMVGLKDSIESREKIKQLQNIEFGEELRSRELEEEKMQITNEIRTYALLGGIAVFMLIAFIFYRNSRLRRKTNQILEKQKSELQTALLELKNTQAQLIHSEKMASLGELTAGIAHEIQNPLNFVNNFSEVNNELVAEMQTEIDKGNLEEVKAIANDIQENGQKINHHGKRADAIVKGMLQHSRKNSGQKEPTDINALADEFLKLSYQGIRAKDKSFNANIKTDFDLRIGKINIVPQDIGRVFLNLYNNAFYAVAEKNKQHTDSYNPTVSVSTKKSGNKILITVSDNANGIPDQILDKIFQPFFTTKPTGEGTGLGLSLSYDIIKSHGGELKVKNQEGGGAAFVISLPLA
jgi:signal transduction histidine kinase